MLAGTTSGRCFSMLQMDALQRMRERWGARRPLHGSFLARAESKRCSPCTILAEGVAGSFLARLL